MNTIDNLDILFEQRTSIPTENELLDTQQYKLMMELDAFPKKNLDSIFRLINGVVVGKKHEGQYLVECGKQSLLCSSKSELQKGDEVKVYTDDGVRGDIDKGEIHGEFHDSMLNGTPITLENIKLVKGGYTSMYKGVSVFVPGSQIELNICDDFSKHDGQTVDVIVMSKKEGYNFDFKEVRINYTASRKKLLKRIGLEEHFEEIRNLPKKTPLEGKITGFKRGKREAFVEFKHYHLNTLLTGMDVDTYRTGDEVSFYVDSLNYKHKRIYSKAIIKRATKYGTE